MASMVGLLRVKPQQPIGPDGRMALGDHFRELRGRLLRSLVVLIAVLIAALFFYGPILEFVIAPYQTAMAALGQKVESELTINGVGGPLTVQLKMCALVAVVLTSPYWLYQIWAFILPGLHPREKKWSRVFVAVAGPLFMGGVALGYLVLPKGIQVLIGFTNDNFTNLVEFNEYLSFMSRMLLVFGVAMEIPLFVVMLNLVGILSGKTLGRYRPWIILGTFIFAAVATPSTDPISMCLLAAPMLVLFVASEVIARLVDRARGKRKQLELSPDEKSVI